eukprot:TRINITY_DN21636_c0_g1_i1.p1 TRINITY_DN21636_c0_g1~~TRINITY_DN21636_c0_g1_i1.p1  ORF type:complete len:273 (+),score=38.03 TRINITY_DN21636_c0_g1_i1:1340-2158(+)
MPIAMVLFLKERTKSRMEVLKCVSKSRGLTASQAWKGVKEGLRRRKKEVQIVDASASEPEGDGKHDCGAHLVHWISDEGPDALTDAGRCTEPAGSMKLDILKDDFHRLLKDGNGVWLCPRHEALYLRKKKVQKCSAGACQQAGALRVDEEEERPKQVSRKGRRCGRMRKRTQRRWSVMLSVRRTRLGQSCLSLRQSSKARFSRYSMVCGGEPRSLGILSSAKRFNCAASTSAAEPFFCNSLVSDTVWFDDSGSHCVVLIIILIIVGGKTITL